MNVSSQRYREIRRNYGADVRRANALARPFVMVRSGLRRFRRATILAHFRDGVGEKVPNENKYR
jgi:hypothetical protein